MAYESIARLRVFVVLTRQCILYDGLRLKAATKRDSFSTQNTAIVMEEKVCVQ